MYSIQEQTQGMFLEGGLTNIPTFPLTNVNN